MCQSAALGSKKKICYSHEQLLCLDRHITRHFGPITQVLSDASKEDLKIDLLIISPNQERDFYTIVTKGLGCNILNTQDSKEHGYNRCELIICLDKKWSITKQCLEGDIWPLRLLLHLCHYHESSDKIIASGMTFDNHQRFASNTDLCAAIIEELCSYFSYNAHNCLLPNYEVVHFLQVLPIYKSELIFLEQFDFRSFRQQMFTSSFIVSNDRDSGIDPISNYHRHIACDSRWYQRYSSLSDTNKILGLDYGHLAWFLRFCYDSELFKLEFYETFDAYSCDLPEDELAKKFLDLIKNQLGGIIDRRYFNSVGQHFINMYLEPNNYPCYLTDLEDLTFNHVGTKGFYHGQPHYLSLSKLEYTKNNYDLVRALLRSRLASINNQVFYDSDTNFHMMNLLSKHLNCTTSYYPSLKDKAPLMAHLRHAIKMSFFQQGFPVLIEVSTENVYRFLKLARHKVLNLTSDNFALECREDNLVFDHEFALNLCTVDLRLQDDFRKDPILPISHNYYGHILDLLKAVFKISPIAKEALKELIYIYNEKLSKQLIDEQYQISDDSAHHTHESDAKKSSLTYHLSSTDNNICYHQELKTRTNLARCNDDTNLNIFDLKSIYCDDNYTTKPLLLAHLPIRLPYDSFGYLPYLIETPGLSLKESLDIFGTWYHDFGAMPIVFGTHMVEFITPKPISARLAKQLAYEIIALCPKIRLLIDDKTLSLDKIINDLKGSQSFTLDFSCVHLSLNKPYGY